MVTLLSSDWTKKWREKICFESYRCIKFAVARDICCSEQVNIKIKIGISNVLYFIVLVPKRDD